LADQKVPALVLGGLLVGLGLGAHAMAHRAWERFLDDPTPFGLPPREPPVGGPALAERVVLLLVDGLSHARSLDLPGLNALRQRGADYLCTAGLPSLSNPGRGVLFTGAWQEIHGQITNFNVRPLRVDTVFDEARRAGLRVGVAGTPSTLALIGRPPDRVVPEPPGEPGTYRQILLGLEDEEEAAVTLAADRSVRLAFIEVNATDDAGHLRGAASLEYRTIAQGADRVLQGIASRLDPSRDAFVVTSDHGHTAGGGHGGPERSVVEIPLVFAGAGIRPGIRGEARQIDVAPTVSALLGVPPPASNQGRILTSALEPRDGMLHPLCLQREAFVRHYASVLGLSESVPGCAGETDAAALAALDATEQRAKAAWQGQERTGRAVEVLVFWGVVGGSFLVLGRLGLFRGTLPASAAGLLGALLYYALLPVVSVSYSLSSVNKESSLGPLLARSMVLALGLAFLASAVGIPRGASWLEGARAGLVAGGAFLLPVLLKMSAVYARQGVIVGRDLPNPYWGFGFYLDALAVIAVGYAAPVMATWGGFLGRLRRIGAPA
jgi:hypothetical protein